MVIIIITQNWISNVPCMQHRVFKNNFYDWSFMITLWAHRCLKVNTCILIWCLLHCACIYYLLGWTILPWNGLQWLLAYQLLNWCKLHIYSPYIRHSSSLARKERCVFECHRQIHQVFEGNRKYRNDIQFRRCAVENPPKRMHFSCEGRIKYTTTLISASWMKTPLYVK